jgi:hypothetical protein
MTSRILFAPEPESQKQEAARFTLPPQPGEAEKV